MAALRDSVAQLSDVHELIGSENLRQLFLKSTAILNLRSR